MRQEERRIQEVFEKAGRPVSEKQAEQLFTYYEMLVETNRVMNLTAITEFEEVLSRHFLDSATLLAYEDPSGKRMIDVGTGAGFPGIPLKILCPELKLTLLDSLNKRIGFLKDVAEALGLSDVELVHSRAEDGGRNPLFREQFDFAVSRAVANLSTLSEYCLPFVKVGGCFVSYKSGKAEEETAEAGRALSLLGARLERVEKFTVSGTDLERSLLFIQKEKPLSKKYPRKAGTPGKMPL